MLSLTHSLRCVVLLDPGVSFIYVKHLVILYVNAEEGFVCEVIRRRIKCHCAIFRSPLSHSLSLSVCLSFRALNRGRRQWKELEYSTSLEPIRTMPTALYDFAGWTLQSERGTQVVQKHTEPKVHRQEKGLVFNNFIWSTWDLSNEG